MANPNSKRGRAIAIMTENAQKPAVEVMAILAEKIGLSNSESRAYYKYLSENGMAPGQPLPGRASKAKAAKPAKPVSAKEKAVKRMAAEVVTKTKKAEAKKPSKAAAPVKSEKTDAELAEIKAKNLARLKDIASRTRNYTAGQIANPIIEADGSLGPIEYHESFAAPAFLNKSDLDVVL